MDRSRLTKALMHIFMIKKILVIKNNRHFMRYFRNSSWMFAEQCLRVISSIFVGIYVARYLGPEQLGLLSYSVAIVGVFVAIARLGMQSVLIRELVKYPERKNSYMGTAFFLMLLAGGISVIVISGLVGFIESDFQTKIYIWIISVGLLFQAFLVFDYAFQSEIQAKFSSIGKSIALFFSALIKVYLVLINADLLWFSISYSIDSLLIAVCLLYIYMRMNKKKSCFLVFDIKLVKPLLKSSWPMIMSGIAGMILVRIDQIMIKNMLDSRQLGLYSAATRIYEGWAAFIFVLSMSILPMIVKLKAESQQNYEDNFTKLFSLAFWASVIFSVFITAYSEIVIELTFGEAFSGSSSVLVIMVWATALSAFGFMSARFMIVEKMEKKVARRNWIAIVINIPLNLFFIPVYGIEGAAMASLISLFIVHYCIDIFDKDLKVLLKFKNNAILLKFKSVRI